jgi:UDP-N-acetylmuramate--alanine ligase
LPIYPARELPIEGVTSEWLLGKVHAEIRKTLVDKEELVDYLHVRVNDCLANEKKCVVVTMGAGDIDRLVENITRTLKYENYG